MVVVHCCCQIDPGCGHAGVEAVHSGQNREHYDGVTLSDGDENRWDQFHGDIILSLRYNVLTGKV